MKNHFILFIAILPMLILASCTCDDEATTTTIDIQKETDYDKSEKIDRRIFFLGLSASDYIGQSISERCNSLAYSAADAEVLVVKSADMSTYHEVLAQAYEEGKIIIETEPTAATHSAFYSSIDAPVYISDESQNDLIILATCRNSCYQLQNPYLDNTYIEYPSAGLDHEEATESGAGEQVDRTNYTIEPVSIGKNVAFFSTLVNSLCKWVDETPVTTDEVENAAIPTFDGDLYKAITDASRCQHSVKTFTVGAKDFTFSEVIGSDPDKVTRYSTIDASIYIAPLYVFNKNGSTSGDYYFVNMSLVSHNKPLYGLYKIWHGWVRTWAHIFYSKNIKWDATLQDTKGQTLKNITFFHTPQPTSTASSTTYNSGFSTSLNVGAQGGITGQKPTLLLTVGSAFTWSNNTSRTIQDQSIEMSTDPTTRAVNLKYITNNDKMEDETDDAIPSIARTDQKCEGTWVWHVSNIQDNDATTRFNFNLKLEPEYGYMWRHATWSCEGWKRTTCLLAEGERNWNFSVCIPNRKTNGILEVKSTNSQYMYKFVILSLKGDTIAKDNGAYEKNLTQRYQVPTGTYKVEYEIRNGDTGEKLGKYRINNVVINTAETTEKTTLDAEKIE